MPGGGHAAQKACVVVMETKDRSTESGDEGNMVEGEEVVREVEDGEVVNVDAFIFYFLFPLCFLSSPRLWSLSKQKPKSYM